MITLTHCITSWVVIVLGHSRIILTLGFIFIWVDLMMTNNKSIDVRHLVAILHHAPLIPAGMNPFHWNPPESAGMTQESTGMDRNGTGMALEWTKMDILGLKPQ